MRRLSPIGCIALALMTSACVAPKSATLVTSTATGASTSKASLPAPSNGSPAFGNFVRTRSAQLQFCYEDTRVQSPYLAGSATIAVTLGPSGNVLNADIIRRTWSGKGSEIVENCVLSHVRSWRFPATNTDEMLTHSFAVIFTR